MTIVICYRRSDLLPVAFFGMVGSFGFADPEKISNLRVQLCLKSRVQHSEKVPVQNLLATEQGLTFIGNVSGRSSRIISLFVSLFVLLGCREWGCNK